MLLQEEEAKRLAKIRKTEKRKEKRFNRVIVTMNSDVKDVDIFTYIMSKHNIVCSST
jgi:hypothetical protein